MSASAGTLRTRAVLAVYALASAAVAAMSFASARWEHSVGQFLRALDDAIDSGGYGASRVIYGELLVYWLPAFRLALSAALALGGAIALGRFAAAAHRRAGGKDLIALANRWMDRRRWLSFSLPWLVAATPIVATWLDSAWRDAHPLIWDPPREELFRWYARGVDSTGTYIGLLTLAWLIPFAMLCLVARAGLQAARAPLPPDAIEVAPREDLHFRALALWPETRPMVVAIIALSIAVVAVLYLLPFEAIVVSPAVFVAVIAYSALAAAAALSFHSSRVAAGLDGVRVEGSLRDCFFRYADIDSVEASSPVEVTLQTAGRAALTLQLHGADAGRASAFVERVRAGIERAHALAGAGAARLAEARSPALLEQAARGDADYRVPAASRDELWDVLEAPSTPSGVRASAARALAKDCEDGERGRLRFAASHLADAGARAALLKVVEEMTAEEEATAASARAVMKA